MEQHSKQMATALLVIDVQKGLFEKSTPIYRADLLLENINHLIDHARRECAPVFFIQHSSPKTLEKGSEGWKFHPRIQPLAEETIIHKLHPNPFEDTNLQELLHNSNVDKVVVTGLVTHGCVKATCLGAMECGFKVVLVSDGHSSFSKDAAQLIGEWNAALHEKGADVVKSREVEFY